ncbi:MAG: hypothetical protein HYV09_19815 [Deltaproteobacteria bacterium]|nr:hypothetical protein [Deltaproteobacteria bacterium]
MKTMTMTLAALTVGIAGCGGSDPDPVTDGRATCEQSTRYARPGPFVAGVKTVTIDGVVTELWYPADKGTEAGKKRDVYDMREWLPAAERSKIPDAETPLHQTDAYRDLPVSKQGKYPIVLFSHGLGGYRLQTSFLMTHLASWGFVVAAPEHVERGLAIVLEGDLSKVEDEAVPQLKGALAWLKAEHARAGSELEGRLDLAHVAAAGHSMGGAAVSTLIDDAEIDAAVLMSSGGFGETPEGKPLLMMWGSADRVAKPSNIAQAFDKQPRGTRSIGLHEAGHMAFTDLCVIGQERGGVLKIAEDHGIKVEDLVKTLASDGCGTQPGGAAYLAPEQGWPVIDHFVTAQLRAVFAIDAAPVGFDDTARKCFGDRVATLLTR